MDHQIYIDPVRFTGGPRRGMHLDAWIVYDTSLRMKMTLDFDKWKNVKWDRWKWISVIQYIIVTSGYSFRMTREQFINFNPKRELFPGVTITIEIEGV